MTLGTKCHRLISIIVLLISVFTGKAFCSFFTLSSSGKVNGFFLFFNLFLITEFNPNHLI